MHLILFSNVFFSNITDRAFFLLLQCLSICIWFYICKILNLIVLSSILHEARLHQSTTWIVQIKCSARCFFLFFFNRYVYISMGREIPIVPHKIPTLMSNKALLSEHICLNNKVNIVLLAGSLFAVYAFPESMQICCRCQGHLICTLWPCAAC